MQDITAKELVKDVTEICVIKWSGRQHAIAGLKCVNYSVVHYKRAGVTWHITAPPH